MKKTNQSVIKELRSLTEVDLRKKALAMKEEIAVLRLEFSASKTKDTNLIGKKKRMLARLLTVINEKRQED